MRPPGEHQPKREQQEQGAPARTRSRGKRAQARHTLVELADELRVPDSRR